MVTNTRLKVGDRAVYSLSFTRYPEQAAFHVLHVPTKYEGKVGTVIFINNRTAGVKFANGKSYELPLPLLRKMPKVSKDELAKYRKLEMKPSGSVWGMNKATGKRERISRRKK